MQHNERWYKSFGKKKKFYNTVNALKVKSLENQSNLDFFDFHVKFNEMYLFINSWMRHLRFMSSNRRTLKKGFFCLTRRSIRRGFFSNTPPWIVQQVMKKVKWSRQINKNRTAQKKPWKIETKYKCFWRVPSDTTPIYKNIVTISY